MIIGGRDSLLILSRGPCIHEEQLQSLFQEGCKLVVEYVGKIGIRFSVHGARNCHRYGLSG